MSMSMSMSMSMAQAQSPPPRPAPPLGQHRSRDLVGLLDRLCHLLVRIWAAVILGGLAGSAILSFIQNGTSGVTDPNKYLLIYLLLYLVFAYPVLSLVTLAALLVLTAWGLIARVASAH
jgi:hypothetical protein